MEPDIIVAPADGRITVRPGATAPYTTRIVVRRPSDPKKFNGTVLVEWLNVSGGTDAAPDFAFLHRDIVREGYAWVGASAQQAGIELTDSIDDPNPTDYHSAAAG